MPRPAQRLLPVVLLALVLLAVAAYQAFREREDVVNRPPPPAAPPQDPGELLPNRNVRFGLPGPASADAANRDAYLIDRPQYVLSYNDGARLPNWVSWQLVRSDIGTADRGPFEPDPLLPRGFAKVTSGVYTNSGFDRGHLCPSKDRSDNEANNDPTFYTTNIAPQAPLLNQRAWERLESYCRDLTKDGHALSIVCGPHGVGGTGKNGFAEAIGSGKLKVAVPAAFWKVVMVLPDAAALPRPDTRVIAVVMPNGQDVGDDWTGYRVSAREVERRTGLRFFPAVAPAVADAILSRVDDVPVRPARVRS